MHAIRIRRKLESDTLHLPELKALVGKNVEIIVLEEAVPAADPGESALSASLKNSVLRYDDPFGPAIPPEEWEANR